MLQTKGALGGSQATHLQGTEGGALSQAPASSVQEQARPPSYLTTFSLISSELEPRADPRGQVSVLRSLERHPPSGWDLTVWGHGLQGLLGAPTPSCAARPRALAFTYTFSVIFFLP